MKISQLVFVVVIAGTLAGCGSRRHLVKDHGQSYKRAFATQAVRKQAPPAGALPAGLDPDDALTVNENYRVTMARKGAEKKEPGIIIVEEEDSRAAKRRNRN